MAFLFCQSDGSDPVKKWDGAGSRLTKGTATKSGLKYSIGRHQFCALSRVFGNVSTATSVVISPDLASYDGYTYEWFGQVWDSRNGFQEFNAEDVGYSCF